MSDAAMKHFTEKFIEQDTIIHINPSEELGTISSDLYGTNHRFNRHGEGMWDTETGGAFEKFNQAYDEVGFKSLRYPGGTVGNLFNWKQSIGPLQQRDDTPTEKDFGLDEAARYCEDHNSTMIYMYGAGSGNAKDAADLVEYLNSPNNGSNPNGGIDWAAVRAANGHPEPYNIKYFEIGNEMYDEKQRYWLDGASDKSYIYNYVFGGTVSFTRQPAAAKDDYNIFGDTTSDKAGKSSGSPNQVKYAKYPPVNQGSDEVYVDNIKWIRVEDLSKCSSENVYTIDNQTGKICFGDGIHGNIPGMGKSIEITYLTTHDGFNQYYEAMKSVDPEIKIFSCMNEPEFFELMVDEYLYDGVSLHSYVSLPFITQKYIDLKLRPENTLIEELHDRIMFMPGEKKKLAENVIKEMSNKVGESRENKVNVLLTEYGILNKGEVPVQNYRQSLDIGLYNAKMLMNWIDLGIPVAQKHCLIGGGGGIIGDGPDFIKTPVALMLKVFIDMFGDTRISSSISNNPMMRVNAKDSVGKLQVTASKDADGNVYIMAVNSDRKDGVTSAIDLSGSQGSVTAVVWTLNGECYTSYNSAQQPDKVSIKENKLQIKLDSFNYTFPAHSLTAIKLDMGAK